MRLLDRFRKKGVVEGAIQIRDMPDHHSFTATLKFTRVSSEDAAFPADSPGAPFHKHDYACKIKDFDDEETQPINFRTSQPVGYYYVWLDVWLGRKIDGKMGIQMESFMLRKRPLQIQKDAIVEMRGGVDWPSISDDELHNYGSVDELT